MKTVMCNVLLFIHLWIIFYIIGSIFGGWQQLFIMIFGGGEKVLF